jgi:hypothetical protein
LLWLEARRAEGGPMITFKVEPVAERLLAALNELGTQLQPDVAPLSGQDLAAGLLAIHMSPFNYGLVDLTEPQHLGLMYFWIKQERDYVLAQTSLDEDTQRWAKRRKEDIDWAKTWDQEWDKRNLQGDWYKLAFIGRGSSVAYYIGALGKGYDHEHSVVIGEPDAWVPSSSTWSRGDGYINHESHLIAHWDDGVPAFSEKVVERTEFAQGNKAIIERIAKRIDGAIAKISKPDSWYRIELLDGKVLYALKVVVGTGAGPHIKPEQRKVGIVGSIPPEKILDLDAFMRLFPRNGPLQSDKTVVVHGPNAGIDAVERAGERGFGKVIWLMSDGTEPALLPGNRLLYAPHTPTTKLKKVDRKSKDNVLSIRYELSSGKLSLTRRTPEDSDDTFDADYYVYALGQDPDAPGAVNAILDKTTIKDHLEKVYDVQLRYSNDEKAAVVALRQAGTTARNGLEIIGAAVEILLADEKALMTVVQSQPPTVARFGQLGALKSAIGSQNSVMPSYVTDDVNFSTDDRTVLRTHIAVKYPRIDVGTGDRIVEDILRHRRSDPKSGTNGFHPLGYDAWWRKHWLHVLEYWNTPSTDRESVARKQATEMIQFESTLQGRPGFHTT